MGLGWSAQAIKLRVIAYAQWLRQPIGRRIYSTLLELRMRRGTAWAFVRPHARRVP